MRVPLFDSTLSIDKLMRADLSNLVRLAQWVGAKPPGAKDMNPGAHRFRLACNVMRAIKRSSHRQAKSC